MTASGENPLTDRDSTATGWVAWVLFAAVIVMIAGVFNIVLGLVAIYRDEILLGAGRDLVVLDATQFGWIHVVGGLLQVACGSALLRGATWARVVAVALAVLNAVAQLAFVSAHPFGATLVIALDVVVIWALVVHGRELTDAMSTAYR